METLGQFIGLVVLLFVVFWAGFFTAASMGKPGSQAQQEARELERMRRSRT